MPRALVDLRSTESLAAIVEDALQPDWVPGTREEEQRVLTALKELTNRALASEGRGESD